MKIRAKVDVIGGQSSSQTRSSTAAPSRRYPGYRGFSGNVSGRHYRFDFDLFRRTFDAAKDMIDNALRGVFLFSTKLYRKEWVLCRGIPQTAWQHSLLSLCGPYRDAGTSAAGGKLAAHRLVRCFWGTGSGAVDPPDCIPRWPAAAPSAPVEEPAVDTGETGAGASSCSRWPPPGMPWLGH